MISLYFRHVDQSNWLDLEKLVEAKVTLTITLLSELNKELKPLVNKKYILQKFPGKGGWTYAIIPEVLQDKANPFGWVTVKGSIDGHELKHYKLMPIGNGKLFLPVKAAIRKKIKKEAGDWVNIILYADNSSLEIPDDFLLCLKDEPQAHKTFLNYSEGERKAYIDWIDAAKKDQTKVDRIAETINRLLKKLKFTDKYVF